MTRIFYINRYDDSLGFYNYLIMMILFYPRNAIELAVNVQSGIIFGYFGFLFRLSVLT